MTDDNTIGNLFAGLAGTEIPGGCDDCNAYQTMRELAPGVWDLLIHHDDSCPAWRAKNARSN